MAKVSYIYDLPAGYNEKNLYSLDFYPLFGENKTLTPNSFKFEAYSTDAPSAGVDVDITWSNGLTTAYGLGSQIIIFRGNGVGTATAENYGLGNANPQKTYNKQPQDVVVSNIRFKVTADETLFNDGTLLGVFLPNDKYPLFLTDFTYVEPIKNAPHKSQEPVLVDNVEKIIPITVGGDNVNQETVFWQSFLIEKKQILTVAQYPVSAGLDTYMRMFGTSTSNMMTEAYDIPSFLIEAQDDNNGNEGGFRGALITYDTDSRPDLAFPYRVYFGHSRFSDNGNFNTLRDTAALGRPSNIDPKTFNVKVLKATSSTPPPDPDPEEVKVWIQEDVNASRDLIASILTWDITQEQVNANLVATRGNVIIGVLNDQIITVSGYNSYAPDYSYEQSLNVPDAPPTEPEEQIKARVDADVNATVNGINSIMNYNITQSQIDSKIIENGDVTVTAILNQPKTFITVSGVSASLPSYTKTIIITVPQEPEEQIKARVDADVNATYTAIQSILKWDITQAEINAKIVQNGDVQVTATLNDGKITIVGVSPKLNTYTKTRIATVPERETTYQEDYRTFTIQDGTTILHRAYEYGTENKFEDYLTSLEGWDEFNNVEINTEQKLNKPGSYVISTSITERIVTVTINALRMEDIYNILRPIKAAMMIFKPLTLVRRYNTSSGEAKKEVISSAYVNSISSFDRTNEYVTFSIEFKCPDPAKTVYYNGSTQGIEEL